MSEILADQLACPSCERRFRLRPVLVGRSIKCKCGQVIKVPPAASPKAALLAGGYELAEDSGATRPTAAKPVPGTGHGPGTASATETIDRRKAEALRLHKAYRRGIRLVEAAVLLPAVVGVSAILLWSAGAPLGRSDAVKAILILVTTAAAGLSWFLGLALWAEGKGHSRAWAWSGVLPVGFLVVGFLPDHTKALRAVAKAAR